MRKNLYEQWAASGRTSGTFEFDTEVTINGRKNGSLNTVEQLNDPHTIVYENEEVYFGIVTVEDGKVVILDNNAFEKQEEYEDFEEIDRHLWTLLVQTIKGEAKPYVNNAAERHGLQSR